MSTAAATVNALAATAPLGVSFLPDPRSSNCCGARMGRCHTAQSTSCAAGDVRSGAKNKRSKRIADYYVQRYGDPLDALGQLANTPLRQLIEVLMEADGSAEREARLLEGVDEAVAHLKLLSAIPGDAKDKREIAEKLAEAIDKLAFAASRISGKPGKLALDALALQMQAHKEVRPTSTASSRSASTCASPPTSSGRAGDAQGAQYRPAGARRRDRDARAGGLRSRQLRLIEDGEFSEAEGGENDQS
jgi:hypothetical protein